jgi:hypothetical protein
MSAPFDHSLTFASKLARVAKRGPGYGPSASTRARSFCWLILLPLGSAIVVFSPFATRTNTDAHASAAVALSTVFAVAHFFGINGS